jgi:hypothetical protein
MSIRTSSARSAGRRWRRSFRSWPRWEGLFWGRAQMGIVLRGRGFDGEVNVMVMRTQEMRFQWLERRIRLRRRSVMAVEERRGCSRHGWAGTKGWVSRLGTTGTRRPGDGAIHPDFAASRKRSDSPAAAPLHLRSHREAKTWPQTAAAGSFGETFVLAGVSANP